MVSRLQLPDTKETNTFQIPNYVGARDSTVFHTKKRGDVGSRLRKMKHACDKTTERFFNVENNEQEARACDTFAEKPTPVFEPQTKKKRAISLQHCVSSDTIVKNEKVPHNNINNENHDNNNSRESGSSDYIITDCTLTQNSVSKEALRRLARSWHLKSAASAIDRLVDAKFGVSVSDPSLCIAVWRAAAYLAHENRAKTITLKFVEQCIAINNILVENTT